MIALFLRILSWLFVLPMPFAYELFHLLERQTEGFPAFLNHFFHVHIISPTPSSNPLSHHSFEKQYFSDAVLF